VQRNVAFDATTKSRWAPQETGPAMAVLDAYGGVHPAGITPALSRNGTYWKNWKIARGIILHDRTPATWSTPTGACIPSVAACRVQHSAYRRNQDAMRGITAGPVPGSGYVLERTGELHPFGGAPTVSITGRWPAEWNTAIAAASNATGTGGYVLDAFGALHSFGDAPRATGITGYWHGWRIARDVALGPDGTSGWVLDAYGGLHPFGGAPRVQSPWYTPARTGSARSSQRRTALAVGCSTATATSTRSAMPITPPTTPPSPDSAWPSPRPPARSIEEQSHDAPSPPSPPVVLGAEPSPCCSVPCLPPRSAGAPSGVAAQGAAPVEVLTLSADSTTVELQGRGWGHGIGMGQWGALGYATQHDWTYTQILDHYYGNTTMGTVAQRHHHRAPARPRQPGHPPVPGRGLRW
jgi:hypothetical protein